MRNTLLLPTFSIGLYKGFYYPCIGYQSVDKQEFENLSNFLIDVTKQSYFDKCLLEKVEDSFFDIFFDASEIDERKYTEEIIDMMDKIKNEYGEDSYRARIESSSYSASIYTISSYEGEYIYFRFNDEINQVTTMRYLKVDKSHKKIATWPMIILCYSSKNRNAKIACKEEIDSLFAVCDEYLYILHHLLKLNFQNVPFKNPSYEKNECLLLKHCLSDENAITKHYINTMRKDDGSTFKEIKSDIKINLNNITQYPLIDFNQRETNFISRYIVSNDLFDGDRPELKFNLIPYLESPRYGKILRFTLSYKDIVFAYSRDNDILRLCLLEKINDSLWVEISFDYNNLEEFNIFDSLNQIDTILILTNHEYIPRSIHSIESVLLSLNDNETLNFIQWILSCIIVIHDRPKRTKMIKITERREVPCSNKSKRNNQVEEEFIIRRILKPSDEAKEYVSSHSGSAHRNHEYTIEEWYRADHWRHLKNGKDIYIHETTCHRNLPLSQKEVHIKL